MKFSHFAALALVFMLGWGASLASSGSFTQSAALDGIHVEEPAEKGKSMAELLLEFDLLEKADTVEDREKASPHDRVKMEDIKVYNDQVVLSISNPEWAYYVDTNSMDPVIDSDANTIQIVPKTKEEIHVGDIVAYESDFHEGIITHRVVEISSDSDGWYAVLKGDNNDRADPGRVRFSQIRRIVVAVIY